MGGWTSTEGRRGRQLGGLLLGSLESGFGPKAENVAPGSLRGVLVERFLEVLRSDFVRDLERHKRLDRDATLLF